MALTPEEKEELRILRLVEKSVNRVMTYKEHYRFIFLRHKEVKDKKKGVS